jgi:diguanylate cyclase (GGDEF)-like protein
LNKEKYDNQLREYETRIRRLESSVAMYREELGKLNACRAERDLYRELSRIFASGQSFDEVFAETLEVFARHIRARYFGFFWLDPQRASFIYRYGRGYRAGYIPGLPVAGSLMGDALHQRSLLWEPDLRKRGDYIPLNQDPAEYNLLCTPLSLLGNDAGVLRIANIDPESVDTGREVLQNVTPLLCSSLERLLLQAQNERTLRGLETNYAIVRLLEKTLTEKAILSEVCNAVPGLFECVGCVVALLDKEKRPVPAFSSPPGIHLAGNPGSELIVLRNLLAAFPKGSALIKDMHADKRWSWPDTRVRSLCMAPLRYGNCLRGVVVAIGPASETYDTAQLQLLSLAASQTSMTLERAAYLRRQEDLARTDGLTGLLNHRVFQERIREEIDRALRYNRPLSLILFDIDHFKKFNDTYGHPIGDQVLKMTARTIRGLLRRTDQAFRYGGEEFCILLPETGLENAVLVAERLRQKIAANRTVRNLSVTISLGVASFAKGETPEAVIKRADTALYRGKEGGRNRVVTG